MLCLCGKPHWVNYHTLYPLPEGLGDYFADDIQRPIHVGIIHPASIGSSEQPALHTLADVAFVVTDRLTIQKAAFAVDDLLCVV